jgi:prepilin-type N-terminal cleavage/methylation domain-containing protein
MRRRHNTLKKSLGYTIVEVMMALAVLSIGATGVVALQKTAVIGNVRARNLASANALAASWIDRLRVDGLRWRVQQNGINTIVGSTAWLTSVGTAFPPAGASNWIVPNPVATNALAAVEIGADVRGFDDNDPADQGFCVAYKLTQLLPNMIRADVRVYWLRHQGGGTVNGTGDVCRTGLAYQDALDVTVGSTNADRRYHFVHLSTAILRNDD